MDQPFPTSSARHAARHRPARAWFARAAMSAAAALTVVAGLASANLRLNAQVEPKTQNPKPKIPKKATVPFTMLPSNHMLVEARINGKGPYHLIFDLGAPVTLLGNRASEESGVVKAGGGAFLFGMRGEAEIDSLHAGDLTVTKLPAIVFDHPLLKALGDMIGQKLDGIMGFTLFARYKTTIDYQAHRMTFEPVDFEVRDLLKDLQGRMMGPRVERHRVVSPQGVWGVRLGTPTGGIDAPGVPIAAVADGSPAAKAGLKPGDVIHAVDGRWTAAVIDVYDAAADVEPGRAAEVDVLRDGKEVVLTVTPAAGA